MEDAGWRLGHQDNPRTLRRGYIFIQVDRLDNDKWLFGLEGLGNDKRDLVVDRTCGLEEIEFEQQ